jgi:hypothetical protein
MREVYYSQRTTPLATGSGEPTTLIAPSGGDVAARSAKRARIRRIPKGFLPISAAIEGAYAVIKIKQRISNARHPE